MKGGAVVQLDRFPARDEAADLWFLSEVALAFW